MSSFISPGIFEFRSIYFLQPKTFVKYRCTQKGGPTVLFFAVLSLYNILTSYEEHKQHTWVQICAVGKLGNNCGFSTFHTLSISKDFANNIFLCVCRMACFKKSFIGDNFFQRTFKELFPIRIGIDNFILYFTLFVELQCSS